MEGCILCLEINKDFVDSITVNSTKWQEFNIRNLIDKHLWPMESIQTSSWLCSICWQELYDFHKFYIRIEEAHTEFGFIIKNKIENTLENKDLNSEQEKTNVFSLKDLNETHYEPEISIHDSIATELELEVEEKPLIKEESEDELCEDDIPLKQRRKRRSKDSINYAESNNEDPLNECEKSKKSKTVNTRIKKTKDGTKNSSSPKKTTNEQQSAEQTEIKLDPDLIQSSVAEEAANVLNDLPDNADYSHDDNDNNNSDSDSNFEHDEDKSKKINKKKSKAKSYNKVPKTNRIEHNKFLAEHFKISCVLCQIPIEPFKALRKHFEVVHQQRGYVICCNKKFFRRSVIVEHIQRHLDPTDFKCQECGKVMSDRRRLELHIKAHEGKIEKNHCCDICKKCFNTNHGLKTHKMIHLPEEERRFPCPECGKNFGNNYLLSKHDRTVHQKKNTLICYICGKSIRDKQAFERHMLEHEGKEAPTISCEICGLRVVNKDGLKRHKAVKHPVGGKQEHICPICSKVSPNIKAHRSHVSYNHKMGRDHKCTICEKAFKKPQALTEHMASHTGDVLYTCSWCPKTFNSSSYMHNHRKKAHPKEFEEETRKKYSGNLPPNFKLPSSISNVNNEYPPIPLKMQ